tara:strand:+ start:17088 stop:17807 length:720 start_codon:yes stop_codon:yes gene_type:complete
MNNNHSIINEFGTSAELIEILGKKNNLKNEIENWCHTLTFSIVYAAQKLKDTYDKKLEEYNKAAKNGDYLYLTPNIKINRDTKRTYLVLRWARLVNGTYLGRPSNPKEWSIREASRAGKLHYSIHDLKPHFYNIDHKMYDLAIQVEEGFRKLRIEYLLLGEAYKLARKLSLPDFQELLISDDIDLSTEDSELKQRYFETLSDDDTRFNALNLPKSVSLLNYTSKDLTEITVDPDEDYIF